MTAFIFFLIGLLLGGCVGVTIMCALQINRIKNYSMRKEDDFNETNR